MTSKLSLSFRIYKGDQLVREERLAQNVIKVGKVPSAHLRIDDESVSRMHAIVEVTGDGVQIIDLGSTRGTFVNGARIHKAKLETGDSIVVGDTRVEIAIGELAHADVTSAPVSAPAPRAVAAVPPPPPAVRQVAPVARVAPVAPVATAAFLAPVAPHASADEVGGAKAVEVAAMLGDSVIGVKHCMDPRSGKVTRATWGFAAGGLACLIASASAFYVSVDTAASNRAAFERHTQKLNKPAYSFRPQQVGGLTSGLAFGGLGLGLAALTLALVRSRGERKSPFYRIGTAPGVEQPLEGAPSESFPLVAPSGDDFVFNYGPGIDGELIAGGVSTPLSELAMSAGARPSTTTPGAIEIPIPMAARIRARAGQATFLVSAVARPKRQAAPVLASMLEGRAAKYVAGSLATHLALVALLYQVAVADTGAPVDFGSREALNSKVQLSGAEDPPPPKVEDADTGSEGDGSKDPAKSMALDEGKAGDPSKQKPDGKQLVKNNNVAPQLSREQALEEARNAGIMGSTRLRDSISSLTSDLDFSSGFDHANQRGALDGVMGEGNGTFGHGLSGTSRGGGCFMPPCGIIGTPDGYKGTIGRGKYAGDGYGPGNGGKGGLRNHIAQAPVISTPIIDDNTGIDKKTIKRYVKQREAQISYCYEKELLARPGIAGEVKIQFLISATGTVQSSSGTGFDSEVTRCVASVIKSIAFPMSKNGSPVAVNYPFVFRHAGGK